MKRKWIKASSAIEYMALIVFVLTAFTVFQKYIIRGFMGKWKQAGDMIGQDRQYDPRQYSRDGDGEVGDGGGTLECFYDNIHCKVSTFQPNNTPPCQIPEETKLTWVNTRCFDLNCDCTIPKESPAYLTRCLGCIGNLGLADTCASRPMVQDCTVAGENLNSP